MRDVRFDGHDERRLLIATEQAGLDRVMTVNYRRPDSMDVIHALAWFGDGP